MCDLCLSFPHLPGCPNAPEPEPVYKCVGCKEGIFSGDEYYESYRGPVCKECLDNMTVMEFIEFLGENIKTAEEDYDQREGW